MKNVMKLIKKRGYSAPGFAREVFKMKYNTFYNQVTKGTMRYKDIVRLCELLHCDFKDL